MVATWNPAANAGYYSRQTSYYAGEGGVEPRGLWYAPAGDLGLTDGSMVETAMFERLFAGLDDRGGTLMSNGGRLDRVPAFDVTLSAPRSVSLLWALGDEDTRTAIEAAHAQAVRRTLELMEREASFGRRGRNGGRIEKVALSAACFRHGESRPAEHADGVIFADPNLHTHCVLLNLASRSDKSIGALHSKITRDWKMASGAAYHAALAANLLSAGYGIDRIGRNGVFEVAGVDDGAIEYFSARRREIVEELALAGVESGQAAALAAAVAKTTRAAKVIGTASRGEAWSAAARRIGFDIKASVARMIEAASAPPLDTLLAERLAALPTRLTETKSVLERRELFRAVGEALVGTGLGAEHIALEVDKLLDGGLFVEIGRDRLGLPRYSTKEMIRIEREIVDMATLLSGAKGFALNGEVLSGECSTWGLSEEQTSAVLDAAQPRNIAVIEGAPGVGKTTLLAPLVAGWKDAGYRIVGAATAWRVANALRDDLGIESRATTSWLARVGRGKSFLDARTVLIVDEAGLLSSREMHALMTQACNAGAKVLLVGDRNQLQAIGAGSGLRLVTRGVDAAKVKTIVRQHEPWARDAVAALGRGDVGAALEAFEARDLLVEADGQVAAIGVAVDRVEDALVGPNPASALILARTNAEVAAIGREVRDRLRRHGILRGVDVGIDTVTPSGHAGRIELAAGDRIRFLARNDDLGVINGTTATVIKVEPTAFASHDVAVMRHATIEARIGERVIRFDTSGLADDHGRAKLSWAYGSTVYSSQGMTVERAVVLLSPEFDRHDIYVAASRARIETVLVTDSLRIASVMSASGSSGAAGDREARRQWLAKRLSIAHIKETTLDFTRADLPDLTQEPLVSSVPERLARSEMDPRQRIAFGNGREVGHEL